MVEWSLESCYKTNPQGPKPYLKKVLLSLLFGRNKLNIHRLGFKKTKKKNCQARYFSSFTSDANFWWKQKNPAKLKILRNCWLATNGAKKQRIGFSILLSLWKKIFSWVRGASATFAHETISEQLTLKLKIYNKVILQV